MTDRDQYDSQRDYMTVREKYDKETVKDLTDRYIYDGHIETLQTDIYTPDGQIYIYRVSKKKGYNRS